MNLVLVIVLFLIGIALIIKGGDVFVDAAAWIAEVSGIPKVIVGATVVSLATTLPEIIVSVFAALSGSADIAIGNAIGSVTANIGLILSICALFSPFAIKRSDYLLKGILMVLAAACIYIFSLKGSLSIFGSILLLAIFIVFVIENIRSAKRDMIESDTEKPEGKEIWINVIKFLLGTAGIVVGARLLVDNGQILAIRLGIPEAVVGVTLIAIGTSLPELVTTITAVSKKHGALSVGNIIGANIIDTTLIVPLCGFVSGEALPAAEQSIILDMPVCLLTAAIAIIPMLICKKLMRWQGVALLSVYAAYLFVMIKFFI